MLRDLQDRGYTPGDITFLTRTAREGTMLVDLLLRLNSENTDGRYRYDVISSESLLIRLSYNQFVDRNFEIYSRSFDRIEPTVGCL